MHALFFGLKRAHHGTLRFTRPAVTAMGLTAARFDMLAALKGGYLGRMLQTELRQKLGVSRATVSRMLGSLEKLRLVRRERDPSDGRRLIVCLTVGGLTLIRRAIRFFMHSGLVARSLARALVPAKRRDDDAVFAAMDAFEAHLKHVRNAYGDVATLYYPWHPDD